MVLHRLLQRFWQRTQTENIGGISIEPWTADNRPAAKQAPKEGLPTGLLGEELPAFFLSSDHTDIQEQALAWTKGSGAGFVRFLVSAYHHGLQRVVGPAGLNLDMVDLSPRPGQEELIAAGLAGGVTVASLSTGFGKSLAAVARPLFRRYFATADKTTLLFTPYTGLTASIAERCAEAGLRVAAAAASTAHYNPETSQVAHHTGSELASLIMTTLRNGDAHGLPELLCCTIDWVMATESKATFNAMLKSGKLDMIVVDEAHDLLGCKEWRSSCQEIAASVGRAAGTVPLMLLSGSLPPATWPGLLQHLGLSGPFRALRHFSTPKNVRFQLQCCPTVAEAEENAVALVLRRFRQTSNFTRLRVIVIVASTLAAGSLAGKLRTQLCVESVPLVSAVTAQNQASTLQDALAALQGPASCVIVATSVINQGYDYTTDVSVVAAPYSAAQLLQSVGRCGRDGKTVAEFSGFLVPTINPPRSSEAFPFFSVTSVRQLARLVRPATMCHRVALAQLFLGGDAEVSRGYCCKDDRAKCTVCAVHDPTESSPSALRGRKEAVVVQKASDSEREDNADAVAALEQYEESCRKPVLETLVEVADLKGSEGTATLVHLAEAAIALSREPHCRACGLGYDRCLARRKNRMSCRKLLRHMRLHQSRLDCKFCAGDHVQKRCPLLTNSTISKTMKAVGPLGKFACFSCFSPLCQGRMHGEARCAALAQDQASMLAPLSRWAGAVHIVKSLTTFVCHSPGRFCNQLSRCSCCCTMMASGPRSRKYSTHFAGFTFLVGLRARRYGCMG